jgi:glycosyltransferase involved in cell wall biosynthesis
MTMKKPVVSVVIEGYNESLSLGSSQDTVEALKKQNFPLELVELIFVGKSTQADAFEKLYGKGTPFFGVKSIAADGAHYYELKNIGASSASSKVIALIDSDAYPQPDWLSNIVKGVESGADLTAGLTLFESEYFDPDNFLMQAAAAITWGFVAKKVNVSPLPANGFLSHNLGLDAETFQRCPYRTDLGRTCAGFFLYNSFKKSGKKMILQPGQRVVHSFSFFWWLTKLHVRFGHEIFLLRRLGNDFYYSWLSKITVIEPVLTMFGSIVMDVPQWLRFSTLLGVSQLRRFSLIPIVIMLSSGARFSELVGMYLTWIAPDRMRRFALRN